MSTFTVAGELTEEAVANTLLASRCSMLHELVVPEGMCELEAWRIVTAACGLFFGALVTVDPALEAGTWKLVATRPF